MSKHLNLQWYSILAQSSAVEDLSRILDKIEICVEVSLDDPGGFCSEELLVSCASLDEASGNRLEASHDLCNQCITFLFELCKDTSSEENLGETNSVQSPVHAQLLQHDCCGGLSFHIPFRHIRAEDLVS